MLYYFSSVGLYKRLDRTTTVTTKNRDINRAKTFSTEIYTIGPFLRKHANALVSAHDIRSFTNIATDRDNWQKLKKLIICAAKADKTYVNLLRMRIRYYYYHYYYYHYYYYCHFCYYHYYYYHYYYHSYYYYYYYYYYYCYYYYHYHCYYYRLFQLVSTATVLVTVLRQLQDICLYVYSMIAALRISTGSMYRTVFLLSPGV